MGIMPVEHTKETSFPCLAIPQLMLVKLFALVIFVDKVGIIVERRFFPCGMSIDTKISAGKGTQHILTIVQV